MSPGQEEQIYETIAALGVTDEQADQITRLVFKVYEFGVWDGKREDDK